MHTYLLYVYVIPALTYRRKVNSKTCVCKWPWKETLKSNYPIKVLYFSYFFKVNLAQCILAFEFYFLQSFIPPFSFHLWPGLKIGSGFNKGVSRHELGLLVIQIRVTLSLHFLLSLCVLKQPTEQYRIIHFGHLYWPSASQLKHFFNSAGILKS